jgi:hypothetical protein
MPNEWADKTVGVRERDSTSVHAPRTSPDTPVAAHEWSAGKMAGKGQIRAARKR